jgi:uncharacterized protein (DUF2147 family)
MTATIKSLLAVCLGIALCGVAHTTAFAAEPYGTWTRPSTGTQVNFYNCGGKLCGKIAAVKDQARKKEVGTVIIKGAAKSGDNIWKGDLLDVDSGKTYSGVVTLESANALSLKGCIAAIFCRGETWTRN